MKTKNLERSGGKQYEDKEKQNQQERQSNIKKNGRLGQKRRQKAEICGMNNNKELFQIKKKIIKQKKCLNIDKKAKN